MFETSNIALMADSQYSAQTRVQVLLEFLHEREMDLEDLAEMKRVKLEQCVQLCQFQNDANQVVSWIRNGEAMLTASFTIPNSLLDSEQLKKEHEQFQVAIEVSPEKECSFGSDVRNDILTVILLLLSENSYICCADQTQIGSSNQCESLRSEQHSRNRGGSH